jgi:hypothetical protein
MDRASQVLAHGVPPDVPESYRALADHHGNIFYSILYHVIADDPRGKRRPKGNSTSDRTKKRLSLSIYFKCPTLVIRYE